jgi:ATP-dependent protease ClpP protease subunit
MNTIRSAAPGRARPTSGPTQGDERQARRYWGSVEPPKAKTEFFSAVTAPTATGDATVATIRMYGPIDSWGGWWGISTEDVGRVLDALPESVEEIVLRINSPGGEVWEAMAILNMLGAHRASVTAVVDGLAASAASFIAASCDKTFMSPGSQMMIHSPSAIAWGNAKEMRKNADFLDKLEESMVEVYTAKAGAKDWATLLANETWLTAADTVELGLADEVTVVADAGTATTVGTEDDELDVVVLPVESDDDADAEARSTRVRAAAASARAAAPKPPSSSEPGEPNTKEALTMSDTIKAGLVQRLGVRAEATDDEILAAVDEALEERADPTPAPAPAAAAALPEGLVAVDATVLAQLQANSTRGAEAAARQDSERRDAIIATALQTGRITSESKDTWRARLDKDEKEFAGVLAALPENTALPTTELGHAAGEPQDNAYPAHWKR